MNQKGLVAGFLASVIALIFGETVGGLGMWSALAASAKTLAGGWLVLLVIGTSFGYLYSFVTFDKFFGKDVIAKGASFGAVIWIVTLIVSGIFPALGQTVFASPLRANLFLQLLTHLVWGSALGYFYQNTKL